MEEYAKDKEQTSEEGLPDDARMLEPIQIIPEAVPSKKQHVDDIALTQCILCVIAVLLFFGLHWLKPDWQEIFLKQYCQHREEPTLMWIDWLFRSIQEWMRR